MPTIPTSKDDQQDVDMFKAFLRINTMHPNPRLDECVQWLQKHAAELGMSVKVVEFVKGMPVVITTRLGRNPALPSVVLNCHMDVVPVLAEKWDRLPAGETPFTAWEDERGNIFARGAQDMKCVGAQYLCALRRLGIGKTTEPPFLRTVHTLWVPDEEIGGPEGMQLFAKSDTLRELNVGVALDEGLAHNENTFVVFYGERTQFWVSFAAVGPPGHAAKLLEKTAADRLARVVERMTARRDRNIAKLERNPELKIGDVTTVNWTMSHHGTTNDEGKTYAYNVVPAEAKVVFDCRISNEDHKGFIAECEELAKELELKLEWVMGTDWLSRPSPLSSIDSPWYKAMARTLSQWGAKVQPAVFPAATDSRFLRKAGVPAYGFSPMRNVESTLHEHNEFLPRATYLEGIRVYMELIPALANIEPFSEAKL